MYFTLFAIIALTASVASAQTRTPSQVVTNAPSLSSSGGFALFGTALGDQDGDGVDDYAIGAPSFPTTTNLGRVYIYSGKNAILIREIDASQAGSGFGLGIADMPDVDADGFRDVAISAPDFDSGGTNGVGQVSLRSGLTGAVIWTTTGTFLNGKLGTTITPIADVTSDGVPDLAASEPGYDNLLIDRGRVAFLSGASGAIIGWSEGPIAGQRLGESTASRVEATVIYAGDNAGRIYLITGAGVGVATATLYISPPPGSHPKARLAMLRLADSTYRLAVGRSSADTGGLINNGTVELFAAPPTPLWTISGAVNNEGLGNAIANIPDMNGDGEEELAYQTQQGFLNNDSRVRVVTTSQTLLDEHVAQGCGGSQMFGMRDVTNDGRGEWVRITANGLSSISQAAMFSLGMNVTTIVPGATDVAYTFSIDAGIANAGKIYVQFLGSSGAQPGLLLLGAGDTSPILFPVTFDTLTIEAANATGGTAFPDGAGFLDSFGKATTHLYVPQTIAAQFEGLEFVTASLVVDASLTQFLAVTCPVGSVLGTSVSYP